MSEASERETMRHVLAAHSLMSIPELAAFLGVTREIAVGMVEKGTIPSVPVGRRRKVDPIDAAVHVLAGRERITPEEYWRRHGIETGAHARRYVQTVEAWVRAA